MSLAGAIFQKGLRIYRATLKRVRVVHVALYKLAQALLVPMLEAFTKFHTRRDDPLYFRVELLTGAYEKETVEVASRLVKPGMTALDIGAHVGYYARLFSRLVGETGKVVAFEPNPRTFEVLRRNVEACSNVRAVPLALSDAEGMADMYDFLPSSGGVSFYFDEYKRDWYRKLLNDEISPRVLRDLPVTRHRVRTVTLDSLWSGGLFHKVDFIKMDIEGAEMSALQGMRKVLESSVRLTMVMEFYPRGLQLIGVEPLDALKRLRELGFDEMKLIAKDGVRDMTDRESVARLITQLSGSIKRVNILCIKTS